jgi:hypothetical protein
MAFWLYQMRVDYYSHDRYRAEVWEGAVVQNWTLGESKRRPKEVTPGDLLVLFYAKAGATEPGIYGWGIVTFFDRKTGEMHFRPAPPSDYLKMNPVPEEDVIKIIDKIRAGMPQRTIFPIGDEELKKIRQKIAAHAYGISH